MKKTLLFITLLLINASVFAQVTDVFTGLASPSKLMVEGNYLYYLENLAPVTISKIEMGVSDATPEIVVNNMQYSSAFALNGNYLYICAYNENKIIKVDVTQTTPTTTDVVTNIATPNGMVIIGDYLYYSEATTGNVNKIDITQDNPTPTNVVSGLTFPAGMAYEGNYIYVATIGGDNIVKFDYTLTTPVTETVVTGVDGPIAVQVVNNTLYGVSVGDDRVFEVELADTTPTVTDLATGLSNPSDLVFLNNDLFICQNGGNKISQIAEVLATTQLNFVNYKLYPNPANNTISISNLTSTTAYHLYSTDGREVLNGTINPNNNINISTLQKGTYILKTDNGFTHKVVKL